MGILQKDYQDVGYVSTEPYSTATITTKQEIYWDQERKQYMTRLVPVYDSNTRATYDRDRYTSMASTEPLADWEKEVLGMSGGSRVGCTCTMCTVIKSQSVLNATAPEPKSDGCNDCEKWRRTVEAEQKKVIDLKAEIAALTAKRDEYDAEASALAQELERAMTDRDELKEVLTWYELTE